MRRWYVAPVHTTTWTPSAPLDLASSVARYARWGGDPLNHFDGSTFSRAIFSDGATMAYRAHQQGAVVVIETDGDPGWARSDLEYRLGGRLPSDPLESLAREDPAVGRELAIRPGYRPPLEPDLLTSLVTSITAQQVNLTWAATTRRRLIERYGTPHVLGDQRLWCFPAAATLAAVDPADLRAMQFTTMKSEFIVEVARQVASGALDDLRDVDDETAVKSLVAIRGIGRWTAEWTLARHLGRPHVVAAGDLGVRKAISFLYLGGDELLSESDIRTAVLPWGDAANWATHLFLEALSAE